MKIKKSNFSFENQAYLDFMANQLANKTPKKQATIDQAPSTQAILNRPESEDFKWQSREAPKNWKAVPSAETTDEAVGTRNIPVDQVIVYEKHRQSSKNTLGGPKESSVTNETKEKAVNAFMYYPGITSNQLTMEERQKLTTLLVKNVLLDQINPTIEIAEPKKTRFWKITPHDVFIVIFAAFLGVTAVITGLLLLGKYGN